jgi:TonB family protein
MFRNLIILLLASGISLVEIASFENRGTAGYEGYDITGRSTDLPEKKPDARNEEAKERVKKEGVLGIISGEVDDENSMSTDIFVEGGIVSEIDALLLNVGKLKSNNRTNIERKGYTGISYIVNSNTENTSNSDEVESLMRNLMKKDSRSRKLNTKKPLRLAHYTTQNNERSRSTIMGTIVQNLSGIKYAYGRRVKEKDGLKGKVTVKFAIDESGKVIFCSVVNSTVGDLILEDNIIRKIKQWGFEKVNNAGDMTEVVYTFVFS